MNCIGKVGSRTCGSQSVQPQLIVLLMTWHTAEGCSLLSRAGLPGVSEQSNTEEVAKRSLSWDLLTPFLLQQVRDGVSGDECSYLKGRAAAGTARGGGSSGPRSRRGRPPPSSSRRPRSPARAAPAFDPTAGRPTCAPSAHAPGREPNPAHSATPPSHTHAATRWRHFLRPGQSEDGCWQPVASELLLPPQVPRPAPPLRVPRARRGHLSGAALAVHRGWSGSGAADGAEVSPSGRSPAALFARYYQDSGGLGHRKGYNAPHPPPDATAQLEEHTQ